MKIHIPYVVLLALSVLILASCTGGATDAAPPPTVVMKGDRLLGMDVISTTPSLSFAASATKAKAAGAQFITLAVRWDQINPTGITYDTT